MKKHEKYKACISKLAICSTNPDVIPRFPNLPSNKHMGSFCFQNPNPPGASRTGSPWLLGRSEVSFHGVIFQNYKENHGKFTNCNSCDRILRTWGKQIAHSPCGQFCPDPPPSPPQLPFRFILFFLTLVVVMRVLIDFV